MLAKAGISPGGWAGSSGVFYAERRLTPGSSQGLPAGEEADLVLGSACGVEGRGRREEREEGREGGKTMGIELRVGSDRCGNCKYLGTGKNSIIEPGRVGPQ